MEEVWKEIKDFEAHEISNLGRVRVKKTGKLRALVKTRQGYDRVAFVYKQLRKDFEVHRLVALAFIPNPNNLPVVMHLDENKNNNRVDNLQWGSHQQNRLAYHKYHKSYVEELEKKIKELEELLNKK